MNLGLLGEVSVQMKYFFVLHRGSVQVLLIFIFSEAASVPGLKMPARWVQWGDRSAPTNAVQGN